MKKTLRLKVANVSLDLPIQGDEANTRRLAKDLTRRIRAIEERSARVDTQAFAILAAYELAAELDAAHRDQQAGDKELVVLLDRLTNRLRGLLDEHGD